MKRHRLNAACSKAMTDCSPDSHSLALTGAFEGYEPSELFAMWVVPDFLTRWWPESATVDSGVGGGYRFEWPDRNWVLSGSYSAWEPGKRLEFTWNWNHDAADRRNVSLHFEPCLDGGTKLTIEQGPYTDEAGDQTMRAAHLEGWMHFCMRLAGLRSGDLVNSKSCGDPEPLVAEPLDLPI